MKKIDAAVAKVDAAGLSPEMLSEENRKTMWVSASYRFIHALNSIQVANKVR